MARCNEVPAQYFYLRINDWHAEYSFGNDWMKAISTRSYSIPPATFREYATLHLETEILYPKKLKGRTNSIRITDARHLTTELNDPASRIRDVAQIGSINARGKSGDSYVTMPWDSIPYTILLLSADKVLFVCLRVRNFSHGHGSIQTIDFQRYLDEQDLTD